MNIYKTRPIGEIFEYCKKKLQVVQNNRCTGCYFLGSDICIRVRDVSGYCGETLREDKQNVIFKQIDK